VKRDVVSYDYIDGNEAMLAKMAVEGRQGIGASDTGRLIVGC
jgi:hypothetical protein